MYDILLDKSQITAYDQKKWDSFEAKLFILNIKKFF